MSIDNLLNRLDKVKKTGASSWKACCPSHEDKSPSLSIKQIDDGRILIHCFTGCEPLGVLASIGLDMNDLFPERLGEYKRLKNPFPAADILRAISFESLVVANSGSKILNGTCLNFMERERLMTAILRLQEAVNLSGVER